MKREIARLTEEDERLRACFEALSKEVRELREAHAARSDRDWMEGEFRRWHEAQAEAAATVKKLSTRIGARESRRGAALEDIAALFRACLDPLAEGMADLHGRLDALAAGGPAAALGDGVPVLALPSHYSLAFQSDYGDRLTVLFWRDGGPWFPVRELADLLAPAEAHRRDIKGFVAERIAAHQAMATDHAGHEVHLVSETGLALLFRLWTETMSDFDKQRLGRWIADQVIPSALSLRLRETELEPERRPKDFPAAPTEVLADRLFKVYAGDLDGRAAALVKARDLHKFLGFRQSYSGWFDERSQWAGLRNGVHYLRPFVASFRYDHYLTLDAASGLLCQESHPRAIEARDYLLEVARERAGTIEGEAVRVEEGALVPVTFHEQTLLSFKHDGEVYVAMKPLVESMGLGWESQYNRIKRDEVLSTCIFMMNIQMPGDDQRREVVALPLKLLNGWLFGIDTKRVKEAIRADIIAYRRECYDVLYRHWHGLEQKQRQSAVAPLANPADTPPHQPLAIPFKRGPREIPIQVAVRQGKPWFLAFDAALAVDDKHDDPRPAFAGVPDAYRGLWPSPDGESAALLVDEAGRLRGRWRYLPCNPAGGYKRPRSPPAGTPVAETLATSAWPGL